MSFTISRLWPPFHYLSNHSNDVLEIVLVYGAFTKANFCGFYDKMIELTLIFLGQVPWGGLTVLFSSRYQLLLNVHLYVFHVCNN